MHAIIYLEWQTLTAYHSQKSHHDVIGICICQKATCHFAQKDLNCNSEVLFFFYFYMYIYQTKYRKDFYHYMYYSHQWWWCRQLQKFNFTISSFCWCVSMMTLWASRRARSKKFKVFSGEDNNTSQTIMLFSKRVKALNR